MHIFLLECFIDPHFISIDWKWLEKMNHKQHFILIYLFPFLCFREYNNALANVYECVCVCVYVYAYVCGGVCVYAYVCVCVCVQLTYFVRVTKHCFLELFICKKWIWYQISYNGWYGKKQKELFS